MPTLSPELQNLLQQGGFITLFIWLLFRTQARQDNREDKLMGQLEKYADSMPKILEAMETLPKIAESVTKLVDAVGKMERRIEDFERQQERGK